MTQKQSQLKDKTIVLGVTGGIAAYKAADLASKFTAAGANVFTIMTENACQLVGPKTFEAVTGNPVFTDMWQQRANYEISHISLAQQADIIVVAPATANIIAKVANGICDDMLSTTLCAGWNKTILMAPAMNANMWSNPAVTANITTLAERGIEFVGPEKGRLACGDEGTGRMSQPADIFERIEKILKK